MDFCFDTVFVKNDTIYAIGWAVGNKKDDHIEVCVSDDKGNEAEANVVWASRPDVGLAKYGDTKNVNAGIFIEIPCKDKKYLKVRFNEFDRDTSSIIDCKEVILSPEIIKIRKCLKSIKGTYVNTKKEIITLKKKFRKHEFADYDYWYRIMRPTVKELYKQKNKQFKYNPLFSIIVPVYHTPSHFLKDMLNSVVMQSYTNWELILVNASPEDKKLGYLIKCWCEHDNRIKVINLKENLGIADNTNEGIKHAKGSFIAFLDHDDFISPNALYCYVKKLNQDSTVNVFYSDEDKTDKYAGKFFYPHFKSDFNYDLLHANNYMCHFLAVRKSLLDFVGGIHKEYDGAQDYDLVLRLIENTDKIYHCPKILYHWRCHEESTAAAQGNKMYAVYAGCRALDAHYKRIGWDAYAEIGAVDGWYKTKFNYSRTPLVSVLIPNKDHIEDLDVCIKSLYNKATYKNFEIIIIENNSTEQETFAYYNKLEKEHDNIKVVYWKQGFNYSAINNFGEKYAHGEYILLLNNDVEVITSDIFENMLAYAERKDVGIVGAKLIYNDHTVQHAGVLVGAGGLADHMFKGLHEDAPGYMGRAISVQDLSAVTAACLLVKRSVYNEVKGLDEDFQVAFNDVDFCLKVRKAGYLVVYDADVKLFHYESKSRGVENTAEKFVRFGSEMERLNSKWNIMTSFSDPYYNPNMSYLDYFKVSHRLKEERIKQLKKQGVHIYGTNSNSNNSKL